MSRASTLIAVSPWGVAARWSTRSQEQARRNAMASCTALAARRLERLEVEEFVAGYLARYASTRNPVAGVPATA